MPREKDSSSVASFAYGAILGGIGGSMVAGSTILVVHYTPLEAFFKLESVFRYNELHHLVIRFGLGGLVLGGAGGAVAGGVRKWWVGVLLGVLIVVLLGTSYLQGNLKNPSRETVFLIVSLSISSAFGILCGLLEHKLKINRQRKPDPWDQYRRPGQRVNPSSTSEN